MSERVINGDTSQHIVASLQILFGFLNSEHVGQQRRREADTADGRDSRRVNRRVSMTPKIVPNQRNHKLVMESLNLQNFRNTLEMLLFCEKL